MECTCGSSNFNYTEKTFSNGTKHYERWCKDCGVYLSYAPHFEAHPETFYTKENIAEFMFPYGKYKDKTIEEINLIDKPYLTWAAKNLKSESMRERINTFLSPVRTYFE